MTPVPDGLVQYENSTLPVFLLISRQGSRHHSTEISHLCIYYIYFNVLWCASEETVRRKELLCMCLSAFNITSTRVYITGYEVHTDVSYQKKKKKLFHGISLDESITWNLYLFKTSLPTDTWYCLFCISLGNDSPTKHLESRTRIKW